MRTDRMLLANASAAIPAAAEEFFGRFHHLCKSGWLLLETRRDAHIHRQWQRYVARKERFPHRQVPKPEWQQIKRLEARCGDSE